MRRRVEEALDALGIAHLRDRDPATLSGGERQRCAIAGALAAAPVGAGARRAHVAARPAGRRRRARRARPAQRRPRHHRGARRAPARARRAARRPRRARRRRPGRRRRDAAGAVLADYPGAPTVTRLGRAARLGPAAAHRARRRAAARLRAARRPRRRRSTPHAATPGDVAARARGRRASSLGGHHGAARHRPRPARRRRRSRCSAATAPGRPRCCAPSPGCVAADAARSHRPATRASRTCRRTRTRCCSRPRCAASSRRRCACSAGADDRGGRPLARRAAPHRPRRPSPAQPLGRRAPAGRDRRGRGRRRAGAAARRADARHGRAVARRARARGARSTRPTAARSCSPPTTSSSRRACATHAVVLGDGEVVADGDARTVLAGSLFAPAGAARAAAVPHRRGSRRGAGARDDRRRRRPAPPAPARACGPWLVYTLMVVVGAAAFLYPFWLPGHRAHQPGPQRRRAARRRGRRARSWSRAVMLEVRRGTMNGATVALLGMLAACAGPAAPHRPARRRQRHLLPRRARRRGVRAALRPAARPVRDGGVGDHHRRHRAVAAVPDARPRLDGRRRRAARPRHRAPRPARSRSACSPAYGWVWGFLYGAIMNLWFWPFERGGALDWHPGLGLGADAAPLLAVLRGHVARLGRGRRAHQRAAHPRDRPGADAHASAASPTASTPPSSWCDPGPFREGPAMPTIVPNLWFDTEALEAAEYYVSVFPELACRAGDALRTRHARPRGQRVPRRLRARRHALHRDQRRARAVRVRRVDLLRHRHARSGDPRPLLGRAHRRRWRGGPVRLVEGPLRRVVADGPARRDGSDAERPRNAWAGRCRRSCRCAVSTSPPSAPPPTTPPADHLSVLAPFT